MSLTPTWSPRTLLDVHPEAPEFTCVGITKARLRCENWIASENMARANNVLNQLSCRSPESPEVERLICKLAELTLCKRWHGDTSWDGCQISHFQSKWMRKIARHVREHESSAPTPVQQLLTPPPTPPPAPRVPASPLPIPTAPRRRESNTLQFSGVVHENITVDITVRVQPRGLAEPTTPLSSTSSPGARSSPATPVSPASPTTPTRRASPSPPTPPTTTPPPAARAAQPPNPLPATTAPPTDSPLPTQPSPPVPITPPSQPATNTTTETSPPSTTPAQPPTPCPRRHRHAKRRTIPADCPICYEPLAATEALVWCKTQCGQNFHRECWEAWAATLAQDRVPRPLQCTYCRGAWDRVACACDAESPPVECEVFTDLWELPRLVAREVQLCI